MLYAFRVMFSGRVNDFLFCAVCGTAYAVVYLATAWHFLIGTTKRELWKRRVMIRVRKYLKQA